MANICSNYLKIVHIEKESLAEDLFTFIKEEFYGYVDQGCGSFSSRWVCPVEPIYDFLSEKAKGGKFEIYIDYEERGNGLLGRAYISNDGHTESDIGSLNFLPEDGLRFLWLVSHPRNIPTLVENSHRFEDIAGELIMNSTFWYLTDVHDLLEMALKAELLDFSDPDVSSRIFKDLGFQVVDDEEYDILENTLGEEFSPIRNEEECATHISALAEEFKDKDIVKILRDEYFFSNY